MRAHVSGLAWLAAVALLMTGCTTYVTPGAAANLEAIDRSDIRAEMERAPAATFPARIAIARVQAQDYSSHTHAARGWGRAFSVLTVQELLADDQLEAIGAWPNVADVAPLNQLLLPETLNGLDDLRVAAAKVEADVLMLYTLGTKFEVRRKTVLPLGVITLGAAPDRDAHVTSTASGMFVDVRTGFVYGLGEATARETGLASFWSSADQVDRKRVASEQRAFDDLLGALEKTWRGIERRHASAAASAAAPQPASDSL